ncbi:MAG: methyltransferase domain-containing protein [Alphaproteobacteria bacterium]
MARKLSKENYYCYDVDMYASAYDIKAFYNLKMGRIVRRILQQRIAEFWPDLHGLRVMGYGYSAPYLRMFLNQDVERVFGIMPAGQGAHHWPVDEKNLIALSEETELPLETNSVDRVLMIHSLEFSELMQANLREIWRVMKGNGRLLVIVPNRNGLWARGDWSPFGQGTPYSATQITHYLKDNGFIHERTDEALFMPPYKAGIFLKSAGWFEYLGRNCAPFVAGVHMVEASKQLYARPTNQGGSKVSVRGRGLFGGLKPAEAETARQIVVLPYREGV